MVKVLATLLRSPSDKGAASSHWRQERRRQALAPRLCTLHCFDRVICKGHLALLAPKELERFVDYVLKVRRSRFMNVIAPGYAHQLIEHAQRVAAQAGRRYLYCCGSFKKDQWSCATSPSPRR